MKKTETSLYSFVLLAIGLFAGAEPYAAEPANITCKTFAGGGGDSSGGDYLIRYVVGQTGAHTFSAGDYLLQGGFWHVAVVQVEDAPVLHISVSGSGFITLWWEPDDPRWILQETTVLISPVWVDSPSGSTNPVTLPATGEWKFFRLHRE